MKRFLILLTAGWLLYPITNYGAETAQARLYCMSLRFQHGTTYGGTLDLSSIGGPPYNGELYPISDGTWDSGLVLVWRQMGHSGYIDVNLPPGVDANNNGYDDFFEVAQGVNNAVSSGPMPPAKTFPARSPPRGTALPVRQAVLACSTCMTISRGNLGILLVLSHCSNMPAR